jgi:hypothetical protein
VPAAFAFEKLCQVAEFHVAWQQVAGLEIKHPLFNLVEAFWAPDNQPAVCSIPKRVNGFRAIVARGRHEQKKNMAGSATQASYHIPAGSVLTHYNSASLQAYYVLLADFAFLRLSDGLFEDLS